jgi:hypothetical protein
MNIFDDPFGEENYGVDPNEELWDKIKKSYSDGFVNNIKKYIQSQKGFDINSSKINISNNDDGVKIIVRSYPTPQVIRIEHNISISKNGQVSDVLWEFPI